MALDGITLSMLKNEISENARFLTALGDNGVTVIWRPLHEANGNWFWFCTNQGSNYILDPSYIVGVWKKIFKEGWFPELQVITGNNLVLSALVCIVSLGLHSFVVKNKCHGRSRSALKVLKIIGDKIENY